jgi:hypothetical protein
MSAASPRPSAIRVTAVASQSQRAVCLIVGAGLGAVGRNLVVSEWSGLATLAASAVMTVVAGVGAGIALGARRGRMAAFVCGLAGGAASVGSYAVLGLTSALPSGVVYLVALPVLMAMAVTAGVLLAARMNRSGLDRRGAEI